MSKEYDRLTTTTPVQRGRDVNHKILEEQINKRGSANMKIKKQIGLIPIVAVATAITPSLAGGASTPAPENPDAIRAFTVPTVSQSRAR